MFIVDGVPNVDDDNDMDNDGDDDKDDEEDWVDIVLASIVLYENSSGDDL